MVLAAGALLGYLAASGHLGLNRLARAEPTQEERPIAFEVLLPADATLEIDGNKTDATGTTRTFRTPALEAGRKYSYTLKATLGGKTVTRKIEVASGGDNTFDLRADFRAGGPSKDDAKLANGASQHPAPIGYFLYRLVPRWLVGPAHPPPSPPW
jgi:uncharacterized protein (TIGR03000 family)